MGQKRGFWGVMLLACWSAGACDQELVIPQGMKSGAKPAADAPSDGVTAAGGAADDSAARPRLPVATEPVFTAFGGAGAGGQGDDLEAAGQPPAAFSGGSPAIGGTRAAGGAPGAGGKATNSAAGSTASAAGSTTSAAGSTTSAAGSTTSAAGSGGDSSPSLGPPALFFSEYVEGSGSYKALEIYALEASSLEGCELQTYSNGKVEPARLALHGELARGDAQVLCSPTLATAQPSACDRSTSLIFNGDDALALSCGGELLDVIGQIGVDPGDSWGVGATVDHTLRRRCEVTAGRRDGSSPFEIDAEWLTLGADTFSDLGVRSCAPLMTTIGSAP